MGRPSLILKKDIINNFGGTNMERKNILFLCTGNSARSQIAEAVCKCIAGDRFTIRSAGTKPAPQVNPFVLEVLANICPNGSKGLYPKSINEVLDLNYNFVFTVCDRANEECPVFPGAPVTAHWGYPDPAEVDDPEEAKALIRRIALSIEQRFRLFLELPLDKLEKLDLQHQLNELGKDKLQEV